MLEIQKVMMDQFSALMSTLGIKLDLERIDISPTDCPDTCIDYVWRIKCESKEVCDKIKEKLLEQQEQGEQG